ncbi:hypothetical protein [Mesobacillus stamsii]|uniref:Uncharacterized protein n=1 Tax=Mesobacillus stamsii TaxID=225347 RepID=A0ABU0FVW7_9BACI|nr:hypothetical protein [Mesobacillus stamsii]MDQ0414062.1 hypothetical protein [Mesobacillus stamsii]
MKKIVIDSYNLDRISTRMAKDFGRIPNGHEDQYAYTLSSMEGNLLKLHRQDPSRTGWHALTAIRMALLTIDAYLKQVENDFSHHVTPENQSFLYGLLMSFDPYTNNELYEILMEKNPNFESREYFGTFIKCLLRIEKSIELWTKRSGQNGYFVFIENHMGHLIDQDDKMNFSIMVPLVDSRD